MKRFPGILLCLLFLSLQCTADTTDGSKSAIDWNDIAQKNQRPLLAPEPLPAQYTYSTPAPVPVKPAPTPVPVQKVSRSIQEQQLADFLHHDLGSKAIALVAALLLLAFQLAAFIIFLMIMKSGDPQMWVAFNAALVMLLFSVAALAINPNIAIKLGIFVLFVFDSIVALKFMIAVYVGNHLWQQLGHDYWGISMWKANRSRMISVTLAAIVVAVLYSTDLLLLTHPSTGWAMKLLTRISYDSQNQKTAAVLLACAIFAFSEEFLFRGCFQPILTKWFGGTRVASRTAIMITAALWTLGHTGSLSPDWVKFLQIFPIGLFLGWWYKRAGFIGTVTVHLCFNFVMVPLAPYLLMG